MMANPQPNPQPLNSRAAVLRQLPDILLGPARTASSAIHPNLTYVGLLTPWVGLENDVIQTFNNTPWGNAVIAWGPTEIETYMVGDEHDLQGCLAHHIGHVLGRVAQAEQFDFMFRDSKSCLIGYSIIPDFLMSSTLPFLAVHAVGELKVFWISAHRLGRKVQKALNGRDEELRKILGQTANYMQALQVRYAILTTYKDTIFLRQSAGHAYKLEFSQPIQHDETFNAQRGTVTLRQCYLHLASLGRGGSQFQRASVRSSQWVSSG